MTIKSGKVLEQTNCPNCTSSDAFTIYLKEDGRKDATCFSCGYYTAKPYEAIKEPESVNDTYSADKTANHYSRNSNATREKPTIEECLEHPIRELKERRISHATCEKYGVRVGVDTKNGTTPLYHLYPYYDEDNSLTGFKKRDLPKSFSCIGTVKSNQLFGINTIKQKGTKLFITEGELDCLSVYQSLRENSNIDWDPDVISIPTGSSGALKAISENLDRIDNFDQIILVMDQDAPGKQATKELCKFLAGKVYTVKLDLKDPNAMLMAGRSEDLKWAVLTNLKKYQPDDILNANDCWERYKKTSTTPVYPYPDFLSDLNDKLYGAKDGSLIVVTSGTGCGKSQIVRELMYHFILTTNRGVALIPLEEDVGDSIGGLLSIHLNKRILLPDVQVTEDEEKQAFKELFEDGRVSIYDYEGGVDDDNLFSKLRYLAAAGCKFIFLDHFTALADQFTTGNDNQLVNKLMSNLAKFVKQTGTIIFLVVHLRKTDNKSSASFENGAIPTLDDLKGAGGIKQYTSDIFALSRNQQASDSILRRQVGIHVLKSRSTGRTGFAGNIIFDDKTGRYRKHV